MEEEANVHIWGLFCMSSWKFLKAGSSLTHPQWRSFKSTPLHWLSFPPCLLLIPLLLFPGGASPNQLTVYKALTQASLQRTLAKTHSTGSFHLWCHHLLTSLSVVPWSLQSWALPVPCYSCHCPMQGMTCPPLKHPIWLWTSQLKWPPLHYSVPSGNWYYTADNAQLHFWNLTH